MSFIVPRPISTFGVDESTRARLTAKGYRSSEDFDLLTIEDLYEDGFPLEAAAAIMQNVRHDAFRSVSAFDLLQKQRNTARISTSASAVDTMIGGGVAVGKLTEFCGPAGIGKTNFALQLAVNVHKSRESGGASGSAIYIDTENSFCPERLAEMATASFEGSQADEVLIETTKFLTLDYRELVALVYQLDGILAANKKVRLIIIDSIAYPFRSGFSDMGLRSRLLNGLVASLRSIADKYSVAVVIFNQMTSKPMKIGGIEVSTLVPALGESWGHACTTRIMLYWNANCRQAQLIKSPNLKDQTVSYEITKEGIRDVQ